MTTALISDIHGNVDALEVVLADIEKRGIKRILCLGDIIGYGPDPLRCVDLVMEKCEFAMMGNHDFAVLYEPTSFNASAEQSCYWTRSQFEGETDLAKRKKRFEFLGNLSIRRKTDEGLFVHASPRRPINEYIFPDDVLTAPVKMQQIYDRIDWKCFTGHTHVPGVFTDEPDFYPPTDLGGKYTFTAGEKCIVNPGSVGQPRDRDPRASYAILHDGSVEFVRLNYDIQKVADKVTKIPQLNDFLGQRLFEGR
ncbi:phosphodiesterase [Poriferisphaera corsica]|uniref:Phosphodiesterase n=1 Tax=Poriferisphaera corsica TaxID=2528020 RepID=A0A517YYD2_9BACT|nr:metallophosphoesterase family protein [Poriferisphaera corsica]QDU35230.1 phosphodiesterase [Poriferisphaera corsica]